MQELNRTNTIEELVGDLDTAIAIAESYVATTAPFNKEVESWINRELGSNDNDDDGNDGDGGDDGSNGGDEGSSENSDNRGTARKFLTSVGFVALLLQCLLL